MRAGSRARLGLALALTLGAVACTDLGPVERDRCGNGVLEPASGEDCDGDDPACGAPGTAAACRLRCGPEVEGAPTCPSGAACGLDDICHTPTGDLVITAEDTWTSRQLLVGDTTGDHYPELIGVGDTQLDVRLGGPDGTFAASVVSANLPVYDAPRAGDVDGDGLTDVLVPVGIGLFTLVGDAATTLQPILQDSFVLPSTGAFTLTSVDFTSGVGSNAVPATRMLAAVRIAQGPDCALPGGCDVLLLGDGGAGLPAGRSVDLLVRDEIPWARRLGMPEGNVVIALAFRDDPGTLVDESGVFLYHGDAVAQTLTAVGQVTGLPGKVDRGAWFADFDRDGRRDLVVSTAGGPFDDAVMVAWARVDGTFDPPVYLIGGPGPTFAPATPIAWADLDADAAYDMITESGVYFASCLVRNCSFIPGSGQDRGWDRATTGDFNGDGLVDVAAFRRDGVTVDVLLGTGARGFWNEAPLPAPGSVSRIRTGDFDGNGVGDLALVAAPFATSGADEIYVAFGRAFQPPAPPTYMGYVGTVLSLDRAQAPLPGRLDTIDDLLVATARGATRGIAIVLGSTSQRMIAPLIPAAGTAGGLVIVEAALAASLDGDPYDDVVCLLAQLAADGTFSGNAVRVYTSDALGALTERTAPGGVPLDAMEFGLRGALWTVVPGAAGAPATIAGLDGQGRMMTVTLTCTATGCTMGNPTRLLDGSEVGEPTALRREDLDGDDDLDLIATFRGADNQPGGLWIWRNQGGGTFAAPQALPAPDGVVFVDVAAADLDLDGLDTVLLVGRDAGAAHVYAAEPASAQAYGAPAVDGRFDQGSSVASGFFVHAGDLTGDGLADVAVVSGGDRSTPRAITIFAQREARGVSVAQSAP